MNSLTDQIVNFFGNQGFVMVTTIDNHGLPHSSCKSIVEIKKDGRIYLFDLYKARTYQNLKRNANINITAVDEHRFEGYCLKGKAKIVVGEALTLHTIKAWEEKIAARITKRLIRNIRDGKVATRHSEALLPRPQYLIMMRVEEILDLIPHNLRRAKNG
jgi:general stress protein 26